MRAGTSRRAGNITSELRAERRRKADTAMEYLLISFGEVSFAGNPPLKGKHMKLKQTVLMADTKKSCKARMV